MFQFIQPINSSPTSHVFFTPPARVTSQRLAVSHYLRQNLLEFLFRPNFMSSDACFRDYSAPDLPPIAADDAFVLLHPQRQQASLKGIACVYLQFVDDLARPLKVITLKITFFL